MILIQSILLILAGIVGVLWGADCFTDNAARMARRLKISQMVIGLTVVAFGTSAPEFFVSLASAVKGTSSMALGNVIGSNIFNILIIVGVSALLFPIMIPRSAVVRDLPVTVVSSLLLIFFCTDGEVARWEALCFVLLFVLYIAFTLYCSPKEAMVASITDEGVNSEKGLLVTLLLVVVGLVCLVFASTLFVDGAKMLAKQCGVSDAVIGLTVVAGGTSLPELATSIVAARKGQSAMAIGNVLGSCVFNILFIIGITGIVSPLSAQGITTFDMAVMGASTLLLWLFSYTQFRISRTEGMVLSLIFMAYMTWILFHI